MIANNFHHQIPSSDAPNLTTLLVARKQRITNISHVPNTFANVNLLTTTYYKSIMLLLYDVLRVLDLHIPNRHLLLWIKSIDAILQSHATRYYRGLKQIYVAHRLLNVLDLQYPNDELEHTYGQRQHNMPTSSWARRTYNAHTTNSSATLDNVRTICQPTLRNPNTYNIWNWTPPLATSE